jgi:peroxiredoxin Q/BCP
VRRQAFQNQEYGMPKELTIGAKAPAFSMELDDGRMLKLKDLKGKKTVLYFYPKDDTPGCTKEAIAFSGDSARFKRAGAIIIGVSRDSAAKHAKFKSKYNLAIPLGADETGKVTEDYGVWVEKSMYGRKYMGIERATFLIDEKGVIRQIWRKVKVAGHSEDVLTAVKAL